MPHGETRSVVTNYETEMRMTGRAGGPQWLWSATGVS